MTNKAALNRLTHHSVHLSYIFLGQNLEMKFLGHFLPI